MGRRCRDSTGQRAAVVEDRRAAAVRKQQRRLVTAGRGQQQDPAGGDQDHEQGRIGQPPACALGGDCEAEGDSLAAVAAPQGVTGRDRPHQGATRNPRRRCEHAEPHGRLQQGVNHERCGRRDIAPPGHELFDESLACRHGFLHLPAGPLTTAEETTGRRPDALAPGRGCEKHAAGFPAARPPVQLPCCAATSGRTRSFGEFRRLPRRPAECSPPCAVLWRCTESARERHVGNTRATVAWQQLERGPLRPLCLQAVAGEAEATAGPPTVELRAGRDAGTCRHGRGTTGW